MNINEIRLELMREYANCWIKNIPVKRFLFNASNEGECLCTATLLFTSERK